MEHRIKAQTPDDWSDILAGMRDELAQKPNDWELRAIYADALEEGGHQELAEYQRALIENRSFHVPIPPLQDVVNEVVRLYVQEGDDWGAADYLSDTLEAAGFQVEHGEVRRYIEDLGEYLGEVANEIAQEQMQDAAFDEEGEFDYDNAVDEAGGNAEQMSVYAAQYIQSNLRGALNISPDDYEGARNEFDTFHADRVASGRPSREQLQETEQGFRQRQNPEPPQPEEGEKSLVGYPRKGKDVSSQAVNQQIRRAAGQMGQLWMNDRDGARAALSGLLSAYDVPYDDDTLVNFLSVVDDVLRDMAYDDVSDDPDVLLADPEWVSRHVTGSISANLTDVFDFDQIGDNEEHVREREQALQQEQPLQSPAQMGGVGNQPTSPSAQSPDSEYARRHRQMREGKALRQKYRGKAWPFPI